MSKPFKTFLAFIVMLLTLYPLLVNGFRKPGDHRASLFGLALFLAIVGTGFYIIIVEGLESLRKSRKEKIAGTESESEENIKKTEQENGE